jgi:hypothetical protein
MFSYRILEFAVFRNENLGRRHSYARPVTRFPLHLSRATTGCHVAASAPGLHLLNRLCVGRLKFLERVLGYIDQAKAFAFDIASAASKAAAVFDPFRTFILNIAQDQGFSAC